MEPYAVIQLLEPANDLFGYVHVCIVGHHPRRSRISQILPPRDMATVSTSDEPDVAAGPRGVDTLSAITLGGVCKTEWLEYSRTGRRPRRL